ncbi:MAG: hypothetical protein ACRC1H_02210, partial [Caldilineaceae bacterium]
MTERKKLESLKDLIAALDHAATIYSRCWNEDGPREAELRNLAYECGELFALASSALAQPAQAVQVTPEVGSILGIL